MSPTSYQTAPPRVVPAMVAADEFRHAKPSEPCDRRRPGLRAGNLGGAPPAVRPPPRAHPRRAAGGGGADLLWHADLRGRPLPPLRGGVAPRHLALRLVGGGGRRLRRAPPRAPVGQ